MEELNFNLKLVRDFVDAFKFVNQTVIVLNNALKMPDGFKLIFSSRTLI